MTVIVTDCQVEHQMTIAVMRKGEPMNDLISRQAAIDAICKACANSDDYVECVERRPESTFCDEIVALRKLPSAQKKGQWIDGSYRQTCSVCRYRGRRSWLFCPSCGASMRGEEE